MNLRNCVTALWLACATASVSAEDWALKNAKDSEPLIKPQKDALKLDHELVVSGSAGSLLIGQSTVFKIAAGYHLFIRPELQVGVDASLELTSGTSSFSLLLGPTLNLPLDRDFRDAFYFFGGLGFGTVSGTSGTVNEFLFAIGAGKRFHVYPNVMYRPSIALVKGPNDGTGFEIRFFALSVTF